MSVEFFQKQRINENEIPSEQTVSEAVPELVLKADRLVETLGKSAAGIIQSLTGKQPDEYIQNYIVIENKLNEVNQGLQQLGDEVAGITVTQEAASKKV